MVDKEMGVAVCDEAMTEKSDEAMAEEEMTVCAGDGAMVDKKMGVAVCDEAMTEEEITAGLEKSQSPPYSTLMPSSPGSVAAALATMGFVDESLIKAVVAKNGP